MSTTTKDLTQEPPSSPRVRVGGYAILARMADKGRADLVGKISDYHFDCPLDNMLLGFKGVKGSEVKPLIESGSTDEEIAAWLDTHGTPKTAEEVKAWSDGVESVRPYDSEEKREWFVGVCNEVGIDPATNTLFDFLEADDKVSYAK